MKCFKCGISGNDARLLDAITPKGIVKVCERCAQEEGIPIIKRPTTFQLKESEKKPTFKEKFSSVSKPEPKKEERNLKEIVDKNYESSVSKDKKPRPDLVDNFHWIIMRARRLKKISRKKLAEEISEAESAIEMAEQGILPEDDYRLVNKLESFLGVKIRKSNQSLIQKPEPARVLKFDREATKTLTIADLKRMKEEREGETFSEEKFKLEDSEKPKK